MKEYKIEINKDFIPHLQEAKSPFGRNYEFKVTDNKPANSWEVEVLVYCESDSDFFMLGFWLERTRATNQKNHYDLRDISTLTVECPDAFLILCKHLQISPVRALTLFMGDACQHPFITNGSDERMMAIDYLLRAYSSGDRDKDEELVDRLQTIRQSWKGNDKQEEYKRFYSSAIEELREKTNKEVTI